MSRLVCVSNRISLPRKSAAPGGLAIGILSALKRTGGLWFGWGGETVEQEPGDPDIHIRDGVTYATIDLKQGRVRALLQRLRERSALAAVPLLPAQRALRVRAARCVRERESHVRAEARAAARAGRRDLGARLSPDSARPAAARARRAPAARLLPAHPVSEHRDAARAARVRGAAARSDELRRASDSRRRTTCARFSPASSTCAVRKRCAATGRIRVSGDRVVRAEVFPIGVDVAIGAGARPRRPQARKSCKRMTDSLMGRTLMIGVDRLDYSKGLVERFHAYQHFLETYPEKLGRITFLQIAPLSRIGRARVRRDPPGARAGRRPHQRALRRHRLDADPLSQSQLPARRRSWGCCGRRTSASSRRCATA